MKQGYRKNKTAVQTEKLPRKALSYKYACNGAHADCFFLDIPRKVSLEEYIEAFYTTPVFKVERTILSIFARKSSTDNNVKQLSLGRTDHFSAWTVENRLPNQILLCDFTKRTRSWLMTVDQESDQVPITRLYFGSVVVPKSVPATGQASFGLPFHLLSGFHHLYSRMLLSAAYKKLKKSIN